MKIYQDFAFRKMITVVVVLGLTLMVMLKPLFGQNHSDLCNDNQERFIKQRNLLSKLLNQLKQDYGKSSCENLQLLSKTGEKLDTRVSAFGGWCKDAGSYDSASHKLDKTLAQALSKLFNSKRVASFGDGPGAYKRYIDDTQRLQVYDAYDGAPYGPETSLGRVKHLDLTAPQYGLPAYDWIISLEVAEHIPAKYESIYIDNIVRHAKEGVVVSWGRPGQPGLSHVNNRPLEHVIQMFSERGFNHSTQESEMLQRESTLGWLQKNVNVYRRGDVSTMNLDDL